MLIISCPFQIVIGPLPETARGNRYIITLVDYFSKWPEAEPLPNKSANSVALFLYKMFCRYAPIVKKMFDFLNSVI